jgi:hypothetical protein
VAQLNMTVRVSFAWWWKPYVYGLITMAWITGMQPDWAKFNARLSKAIRWRLQ